MLALGLLGVGVLMALGAASWPDDAAAAASPAQPPIDVSELTGPDDQAPQLLDGAPPVAPPVDLALRPTIVCRLLVDAEGRVADARVHHSHLDLDAFETAALDAVQHFRFVPASRGGQAVPVWMLWPVAFAAE